MSGNKNRAAMSDATEIQRHIELVQPRANTSKVVAPREDREKIREKLKVRAGARKEMAQQQLASGAGVKKGKKGDRATRLIPADGGMGMQVE
jgi:large subunit ribosomal protein L24e